MDKRIAYLIAREARRHRISETMAWHVVMTREIQAGRIVPLSASFDPSQPRDESGKWSDTGASSGGMKTKPITSGSIRPEKRSQIVDEANAIVSADASGYDFGFRMLPDDMDDVKVGEKLDKSFRWEDGDNSGENLEGVSTIGIRGNAEKAMKDFAPRPHEGYFGRKVVLVRGVRNGSGQDVGETIIDDAEVVAVWDVGE